jgi:hypothetical protein
MDLAEQDIELAEELPGNEERDRLLRTLAIARGREEHLSRQIAVLEQRLLEAETARAESEQETQRAYDRLEELHATTSWRITAPVRAASRLLGRR